MSQCLTCGGSYQPGDVRCPKCGGMVPQAAPAAPPTPFPMAPQAAPQVVYVQGPPPGTLSDKTRVAYILLGLFLGGLGVHNFYAGHTGRGVAQLLICLFLGVLIVPIFIVWIWVIVEILVVTTDGKGLKLA